LESSGRLSQKVLRAIDANSNRISEGIRVVEEVARFVLDEPGLTERLRSVRHLVREATEALGGSVGALTGARDSDADVGKPLSTSDSSDRRDAVGLVSANLKRAEEGLRVLEEMSTLLNAELSNRFKLRRFELYTLEKEIVARLQREGDR
jgi:thiamine-phosphate pyrophosphorylase